MASEWDIAHPDLMREYRCRWVERNPEKNRESKRRYELLHREELLERKRLWGLRNRNVKKERLNAWRRGNPDKARVHYARRRARKRNSTGSYTAQEWETLKDKYGRRCLSCGKAEPSVRLIPDHIVPLAKGGSNMIQNIQPLCSRCNSQKHAKIIDFRGAA